jgi:hypothetical protein
MEADNGFYKIGTKNAVLPQLFTRNQLEPCDNDFISFEDMPDVETSFRAAVGADSVTGAQRRSFLIVNRKWLTYF